MRKLLYYEFRSTSRMLVVLYVALLVIALTLGLMLRRADIRTAQAIFLMLYGLMIWAVMIVTFVMIVMHFYRNLLKGEGYLMHTLPVPTWMLVASKTIVAVIWVIVSVAVTCVSFLLLQKASGLPSGLLTEFTAMMQTLWTGNRGRLLLSILTLLVQCVQIVLMFYIALSIGGMMHKNKVAVSVLVFLAIVIVVEVIGSVCQLIWPAAPIASADVASFSIGISRVNVRVKFVSALVYSVIFFAGSTFCLGEKLNLE